MKIFINILFFAALSMLVACCRNKGRAPYSSSKLTTTTRVQPII